MNTATIDRPATIRTALIGNTVSSQKMVSTVRKSTTRQIGIEAIRAKAYITVTDPDATSKQLHSALRSFWTAVDIIAIDHPYAVQEVVGRSHEWLFTLSAVSTHRKAEHSVIEALLVTMEHPEYCFIENFALNDGFKDETVFIINSILNNSKATPEQLERAGKLASRRI